MAISLGLAVSPSSATGSEAGGFQQAGTVFNFGSGYITADQSGSLTPTVSPTSTATASATGSGPAGNTAGTTAAGGTLTTLETYLPWMAAGIFALAVLWILKKP